MTMVSYERFTRKLAFRKNLCKTLKSNEFLGMDVFSQSRDMARLFSKPRMLEILRFRELTVMKPYLPRNSAPPRFAAAIASWKIQEAALVCLFATWVFGSIGVRLGQGQEPESATLVPVFLPLTADGEARLTKRLESLVNQASGLQRPLVVLEFQQSFTTGLSGGPRAAGRGTSFERALPLARWLSGPKGGKLRTIASIKETLIGHACLIALACEEIAIAPEAEFGQATIDEPPADNTIRQAYLDIAKKRSSFPPAAVLSMIDPAESLFKVEIKDNKVEYKSARELETEGQPEGAWNIEQLVPNNQLLLVDGHTLRRWQWVAHTAVDREQLSQALRLSKPLIEKSQIEGPRIVARTHLRGIVTPRLVNRVIRAIDEGMNKEKANLILIEVDSPGGNLNESLRLAQYLADIDPSKAEVVCYLPNNALGDAALVPLACDSIYMNPESKLGGPGEASINAETCQSKQFALNQLAQTSGRSIGQILNVLAPDVEVYQYTSADGRQILSSPGWLQDDPANPQWIKGESVQFDTGLNAEDAMKWNFAIDQFGSIEEVGERLGVEVLPKEKETNRAEQIVDWLAGQVWLSFFLFFIGMMAIGAELNAPGVGVPGAIAAICFGLFFWLRFLDGTVEWLEILLIVGGIAFIAIELFAFPGFGIFGFLGIAMLGIGLLFAGQTFILPSNAYQRQRVVESAGQIGLVTLSMIGLAILFRKQIANSPFVRWTSLEPPQVDKEKQEHDLLVDELKMFIGWHGKTLSRCNPSGRASIGDRVLSVSAEEGWLDEGSEIEVTGIQGMTLIVRRKREGS
jgi:membrane-bound serine protease (ClpP class)